jgi:hypothetical protein
MNYRRISEPLIYIGIAVFLTTVAEWQNNVLLNSDIRGWTGYIDTLIFNAIFLGIPGYISFIALRRRCSVPKTLLFQYLLWGLIGLSFEWFAIGHYPWSYAVQIGLFTYWSAAATIPLLFLLPSSPQLRISTALYLFFGSLTMALLSLLVISLSGNLDILLLTTIGSWFLFYTGIIHYLLRQVGLAMTRLEYVVLAIIVPITEIILYGVGLFLVKFIVFVCALAWLFWRIRCRYRNQIPLVH